MAEKGLTEAEAAERLKTYGPNQLQEEKEKGIFLRFTAQLKDPLIFILLAAAAVSTVLGEWEDTVIILAVVLLNGVTGVLQEGKARKALEALKNLTVPHALVCREGGIREIESRRLNYGGSGNPENRMSDTGGYSSDRICKF